MEIVGKMKDFPRKIETGAGKAGGGGGGGGGVEHIEFPQILKKQSVQNQMIN